VGPALGKTIRECDGKVDQLSFWTFSDVFEEDGLIRKPFEEYFGLRARWGIHKSSFYEFALLHKLGEQRIANGGPDVIVTKRNDGKLVMALWNLVDPDQKGGIQEFQLSFDNIRPDASVAILRVDQEH
jgi:xylan 1,4-beta-xylosidase